MTRERTDRRGDAPTVYPLGHPRNPHTASRSEPEARRAPTPHPEKVKPGSQSPSTSPSARSSGGSDGAAAPTEPTVSTGTSEAKTKSDEAATDKSKED